MTKKKSKKKNVGLDARGYSTTSIARKSIEKPDEVPEVPDSGVKEAETKIVLDQGIPSTVTINNSFPDRNNEGGKSVEIANNWRIKLKIKPFQVAQSYHSSAPASIETDQAFNHDKVNISAKTIDTLNEVSNRFTENGSIMASKQDSEMAIKNYMERLDTIRSLLDTAKFQTKISSLQITLNELGFQSDEVISQAIVGTFANHNPNADEGEGTNDPLSIELVLDWLCLNLPSKDLPPRFTELETRNAEKIANDGLFLLRYCILFVIYED